MVKDIKSAFLKKLFGAIPLCSLVPECGTGEFATPRPSKKNKVHPNKKKEKGKNKDKSQDETTKNEEEEVQSSPIIARTDIPEHVITVLEAEEESQNESLESQELYEEEVEDEEEKLTNKDEDAHSPGLMAEAQEVKLEIEEIEMKEIPAQSKSKKFSAAPKQAFVKEGGEKNSRNRGNKEKPLKKKEDEQNQIQITKDDSTQQEGVSLSKDDRGSEHSTYTQQLPAATVESEDGPDEHCSNDSSMSPVDQAADINKDQASQDEKTSEPLISDDVFAEIHNRISANPVEARGVNSIFLFVIKKNGAPKRKWVLNLRTDPPSLTSSAPSDEVVLAPDCSILSEDKDFYSLASGELNPQKALLMGKLKVRGNFLLLQKLQGIF